MLFLPCEESRSVVFYSESHPNKGVVSHSISLFDERSFGLGEYLPLVEHSQNLMRQFRSLSAFLQEDAEVTKAFEEDIETPPIRNIPSPGQLDPDTRIPVINLEDGTRLVGEDAPKNKDLVDWLKLHPTYTVDMPSYVPVSTAEPRL